MSAMVNTPGDVPGESLAAESVSTAPAKAAPVRNRYFDSLRGFALVRVLVFHTFGWLWLPLVFPSMGVMFALAGSLMASSLDRYPSNGVVYKKRLRRLLPPLWMMAIVLVPVMFIMGWTAEEDGTAQPGINLLNWIIPFTQPPASDLGYNASIPLWYITTYMWFVLLSPALLWLWRRWPKGTFAIPFVGLVLISASLLQINSPSGGVVMSLCTFAACWLVGFAHYEGKLQAVSFKKIIPVGLALMGLGVLWAIRHPLPDINGIAIGDIPLASGLYNLGFCLILMRVPTTWQWAERNWFTRNLLTMINRRAMTIYLWGNAAILGAIKLMDYLHIYQNYSQTQQQLILMGLVLAVLSVCVLIFGWVEDLAAKKRPTLFPSAHVVKAKPAAGKKQPTKPRRALPARAMIDKSAPANTTAPQKAE